MCIFFTYCIAISYIKKFNPTNHNFTYLILTRPVSMFFDETFSFWLAWFKLGLGSLKTHMTAVQPGREKHVTHAELSKVMMRITCFPASSNITHTSIEKSQKQCLRCLWIIFDAAAASDVTTHLCGTIWFLMCSAVFLSQFHANRLRATVQWLRWVAFVWGWRRNN